MSATVMRGSSELSGSWKTICTSRRNQRSSCGRPGATGRPPNVTGPCVARSSPSRMRASVDLPEPDSPTMPSVSPAATPRLTPARAWRSARGPNRLVRGSRYTRWTSSAASRTSLTSRLQLRDLLVGRQRSLPGGGEQLDGVRVRRCVDDAGCAAPTRRSRRGASRATSSATIGTRATSWVMNSRAVSSSAISSASRASTPACTVTSRAVVGSSAMSSAGRQARAMAMPTRWRCPPDSWCG